ncbi:MAG TPA: energy transducer TonB [Candidatus Saccharicenans sp.]|nr:energy transducer TonB [Candidatus Saccharicenans sp.]
MKQKIKAILSGSFCLLLSVFLTGEVLAQTKKTTSPPATPSPAVEMQIKVFEGLREGKVEPVKTVTSSFWRYTLSASIKSEDKADKEESQIRRVFNLKELRLLTQDNFSWAKTGTKDFHIFRLDSKEYAIMITWLRTLPGERATCRVEVLEQDQSQKTNLLDTELTLEKNSITAFGFEDASGKPYFVSLKITSVRPMSGETIFSGRVEAPVRAELGGELRGVTGEGALPLDTVKALGGIKPPQLIKRVDPVYPEAARQAGVEGTVVLEVTTDIYGRVANIRVLKSVPSLNQAAIDAVKQWVYEPLIIDGQPKGVIFTVTVDFKLREEEKKKAEAIKTI